MPIYVQVYINDLWVKQYRIGRVEGTTDPDSLNTYSILEFEAGSKETKSWLDDGKIFTHRYGDGVNVCIRKGLEVLTSSLEDGNIGS